MTPMTSLYASQHINIDELYDVDGDANVPIGKTISKKPIREFYKTKKNAIKTWNNIPKQNLPNHWMN